MPVVTRRMAQQAKAAKMDVDDEEEPWQTIEISASKKRAKGTRKRNRNKALPEDTANENPKKRRRIQRASKEEADESDSQDKKKKKAGKTGTKKKRREIIQAVATSERTTTTTTTEELSPEELRRIESMQDMERELYEEHDYQHVVGCDEAGRGPLAGPVVAAACYIPLDVRIAQLTDSKALTEQQREEIFEKLVNHDRVVYGVAIVPPAKIDEINILEASLLGMRESSVQVNDKLLALKKNEDNPDDIPETSEQNLEDGDAKVVDESAVASGGVDYILVDGNKSPRFEECKDQGLNADSHFVVKGDAKVYCIAAASIIAKVTRDRIMVEYDKQYPLFNFAQHKGYPTRQHQALVREHGPCEIHRRSFQPVKQIVGWERPKKQKKKGGVTKKKGKKAAKKKSG